MNPDNIDNEIDAILKDFESNIVSDLLHDVKTDVESEAREQIKALIEKAAVEAKAQILQRISEAIGKEEAINGVFTSANATDVQGNEKRIVPIYTSLEQATRNKFRGEIREELGIER